MLTDLLKESGIEVEQVGDRYRVTVETSQPELLRAIQAMMMMVELAKQMEKGMRWTQTAINAERAGQQEHASRMAVVRMYWSLRKLGILHRKALAQVAESPLAKQLRYERSEIAWAVKAYPLILKEVSNERERESE